MDGLTVYFVRSCTLEEQLLFAFRDKSIYNTLCHTRSADQDRVAQPLRTTVQINTLSNSLLPLTHRL